jgi:hypothetical protein
VSGGRSQRKSGDRDAPKNGISNGCSLGRDGMRGIASMPGSRARTSASPPAIRSASTPPRPLGATSSGEGARRTPGSQRQNKSLTRELAESTKNSRETENESCTWDVKVAVKKHFNYH